MFFHHMDKAVVVMATIRMMSAFWEMTGALLMLWFGTVEKAFKINFLIASISPFVLITVTTIGLYNLANTISFSRLLMICVGVILIFLGLWKM